MTRFPGSRLQTPQPSDKSIGDVYEYTADRSIHTRLGCETCAGPGDPCWPIGVWKATAVELVAWNGYGALGWWTVRPLHPTKWQIAAMTSPTKANTIMPEKARTLTTSAHDWELGRKVS